nr:hypothetical protein CFP56_64333 [Quercus suber]
MRRCSLRPSLKIVAVIASSEITDCAASALVQRCSLAVAPSASAVRPSLKLAIVIGAHFVLVCWLLSGVGRG